jgi:hypothetical protein
MDMFQIWLRPRVNSCSHTETVFIQAPSQEVAIDRAEMLFDKQHVIKAVLAQPDWIDQGPACGCSTMITHTEDR